MRNTKVLFITEAAVIAALIGVGFATGFFGGSTVPDLTDKTFAEAVQIAEDAGDKIEQGEKVNDPEIEKGHIASQTPEPGEEAEEGTIPECGVDEPGNRGALLRHHVYGRFQSIP